MSHPGFTAPSRPRGLLAAVATSPLVPFALFFKKPLEKTFEGTTVAGVRIPGHRGRAAGHCLAEPARWGQGARRNAWLDALLIGIAQMFAPVAGGQPQRPDDRRCPCARAVANLGRRLQPADRGPGDPRRGRLRDQGCESVDADCRQARPGRRRNDRCRFGRLFRHHLADSNRTLRTASGASRST